MYAMGPFKNRITARSAYSAMELQAQVLLLNLFQYATGALADMRIAAIDGLAIYQVTGFSRIVPSHMNRPTTYQLTDIALFNLQVACSSRALR